MGNLTGNWVTDIACDDIGSEERGVVSEIIYFGPRDNLENDFEASQLVNLAQLERFKFDEQLISYRQNNDPECWKSLGLFPDMNYITMHLWEQEPIILELGNKEDLVKMPKLLNYIMTGVAGAGYNKWDKRA